MTLSRLRKIEPLSAALVIGLINAIIGLIAGIMGFFVASFLVRNPEIAQALSQSGVSTGLTNGSVTSALWLIVAYPIIGFISGFVGTFVIVWLYNLMAKKMPIKFEIK